MCFRALSLSFQWDNCYHNLTHLARRRKTNTNCDSKPFLVSVLDKVLFSTPKDSNFSLCDFATLSAFTHFNSSVNPVLASLCLTKYFRSASLREEAGEI